MLKPWGALLLSVLLIATVFPAASAGPVRQTPGPGPINRGGGGLSADGGSEEDFGEGPEPPQLPEIVLPPLTPPDPNLIVTLLHPDRDAVQVGHSLHVYMTVENTGYRFLDNATLALFEEGIPSVLIGQRNVTLQDFKGGADFTWLPVTLGDRTLRAVADPFGVVEETDETDNEASTIVLVTQYPPIGKPDLAVLSTGINPTTDLVANATATVNVGVWNTGDNVARYVVVEVWELERSLMVANYTIPSVLAGTEDIHAVAWNLDGAGPRTLEVRADPYHAILEHNETNNVAAEGFNVRPAGTLRVADPPYIGPWCPIVIVWGDWFVPVGNAVYVHDCHVLVVGNVIVEGSLVLTRSNVTLVALWNNQYRVEVREGGFLSFNDSKLFPIRRSYGISALALADSTFHFHAGSEASWLYGTTDHVHPNPGPGGLQLYTPDTWIEDSTVHYGQTHGIYVGPGVDAGAIAGNDLTDNGRGAGIALAVGANATIQSNTFRDNRFGVWAVESSPGIAGNVIQGNEYGLQFYGASSAVIAGSTNTISGNAVGIILAQAREGPWPVLDGINVTNSERFGITALNSNLSLANSSIWRNLGLGGVGVDIEYGVGGRSFMPVIENNFVATHHFYPLIVRNVLSATIRDNNFTISSHGTWVIDSDATVTNNMWREAVGPSECHQYVDLRSSSNLSRNTFYPGASACVIAVRSAASTTRSRNDTFLAGDPSVYYYGMVHAIVGEQGSYVEVDNATIDNANKAVVLQGASGVVKYGNFTRSARGDEPFSGVRISNSATPSLITHNRFNSYRFGVVAENASAVVEWNNGTQRYFPPDFVWNGTSYMWNSTEWCHICDYGSMVVARNNTYFGGAFGISVESWRETELSPTLVPSHLVAYDNWFNWTGYQAIVSSEAKNLYDVNEMLIARNHAYNVSGAAYGSETAANATFLNNTADGCHGFAGGYIGTWYGCTWVRPGNRDPVGRIEFRGNNVTHANMSAMRANTWNRVVHFYNNAVDCVLCDDPRPYLNESGIDVWGLPGRHSVTSRVENNTVTRAYMGLRIGVWVSDWTGRQYISGAWVNASYNDFTGNRRYGISILNQTDDTTSGTKTSLWWNDLTDNTVGGLFVEFAPPSGLYWNAKCNWWEDANGPNDPSLGPPDQWSNPAGQNVSDYVWYRELPPTPPPRKWWLNNTIDAPGTVCLLEG